MTGSRIPLIIPLLLLAAAAPEAPSTATVFKAPPVAAPTAPSAPTVPNVPPVTVPNAPQATKVPAAPQATTAPKLPPTIALQTVAPTEAMPILGHRVVGPNGKDIARLVDVLVNPNGQPVAAVLEFGGLMGVGNRKIAVHWNTLHFTPAEAKQQIALSLTPDEIKAVPEYKDSEQPAPMVVPVATGPQPRQQ
jgi:hypothetical protein